MAEHSRTAFVAHAVKSQLPYGKPVDAATCYGDRLILASDTALHIWSIFRPSKGDLRATAVDCRNGFTQKGKNIQRLAALPEVNLIIALCQGYLYQFPITSIPTQLSDATPLPGVKKVLNFTIRRDSGRYFLAAVRERQIVLFVCHIGGTDVRSAAEFIPTSRPALTSLSLPDTPRMVLWTDQYFILGFKREYCSVPAPMDTNTLLATADAGGYDRRSTIGTAAAAVGGVSPSATAAALAAVTGGGSDSQSVKSISSTGSKEVPLGALAPWTNEAVMLRTTASERIGFVLSSVCKPMRRYGIAWKSTPAAIASSEPYVLSLHDAGASTAVVEAHMLGPTTLDMPILCAQQIGIKGARSIITPEFPSAPMAPVVAAAASGGGGGGSPSAPSVEDKGRGAFPPVHYVTVITQTGFVVLEPQPYTRQVVELANAHQYAAAHALVMLASASGAVGGGAAAAHNGTSPLQHISSELARSVNVRYALELFHTQDYEKAMTLLATAGADPRCTVALVPELLPRYVFERWWKVNRGKDGFEGAPFAEVPPRSEERDKGKAVSAIVRYLHHIRPRLALPPVAMPPPMGGGPSTPAASTPTSASAFGVASSASLTLSPDPYAEDMSDEGMAIATVDTALVKAAVLLHEGAVSKLQQILRKPNRVVVADAERALQSYVDELVMLYKSRGLHGQALGVLRREATKVVEARGAVGDGGDGEGDESVVVEVVEVALEFARQLNFGGLVPPAAAGVGAVNKSETAARGAGATPVIPTPSDAAVEAACSGLETVPTASHVSSGGGASSSNPLANLPPMVALGALILDTVGWAARILPPAHRAVVLKPLLPLAPTKGRTAPPPTPVVPWLCAARYLEAEFANFADLKVQFLEALVVIHNVTECDIHTALALAYLQQASRAIARAVAELGGAPATASSSPPSPSSPSDALPLGAAPPALAAPAAALVSLVSTSTTYTAAVVASHIKRLPLQCTLDITTNPTASTASDTKDEPEPQAEGAVAGEGVDSPPLTAGERSLLRAASNVWGRLGHHTTSLCILIYTLDDVDAALEHCNRYSEANGGGGVGGGAFGKKVAGDGRGSILGSPSTAPKTVVNLATASDRVSRHDLYALLLRLCVHPPARKPPLSPKLEAACVVLNKGAQWLNPIGALKTISSAPAAVPTEAVGEWLCNAVASASAARVHAQFRRALAESRSVSVGAALADVHAQYVLVAPPSEADGATCCFCKRALGGSVFMRAPDGQLSHLVRYECGGWRWRTASLLLINGLERGVVRFRLCHSRDVLGSRSVA